MLHGKTETDAFGSFVDEFEPRLRQALSAALGTQVGREATAETMAYAWEHWERVYAELWADYLDANGCQFQDNC